MHLKELLDREYHKRNSNCELTPDKPDPLYVAKKHREESVALICALFGYGNAHLILRFLESLDFSLLDASEAQIEKAFKNHYYRFQKAEDIVAIFIALRRLKREKSLEDIYMEGFTKTQNHLDGMANMIDSILRIYPYDSRGYRFLTGQPPSSDKAAGQSPYKRWNMFLRWMIRNDCLDMGLWPRGEAKNLIIPLDTHTFHTSHKLGLLKRKTYDLKAAMELTEKLKEFDPGDPIKYDFALYRIGQEKALSDQAIR